MGRKIELHAPLIEELLEFPGEMYNHLVNITDNKGLVWLEGEFSNLRGRNLMHHYWHREVCGGRT